MSEHQLTEKQSTALALILLGKTRIEVASDLEIALSTLDQWIAKKGWQQAKRELAIKVYEENLEAISRLTTKATNRLEELLDDPDISAKTQLSVISIILSYADKLKNYQIESRLERIENVLLNGQTINDPK